MAKSAGKKIYRVALEGEERDELVATAKEKGQGKRRVAAWKRCRAQILLMADEAQEGGNFTDAQIAKALDIGTATVERVRKRCVEDGVEAALSRREQAKRKPKKLDGEKEAQLVALACSEPPEGRSGWTLELLRGRLVELKIVDSIATETVRKALKKTTSSPG